MIISYIHSHSRVFFLNLRENHACRKGRSLHYSLAKHHFSKVKWGSLPPVVLIVTVLDLWGGPWVFARLPCVFVYVFLFIPADLYG